MVRRHRAALGMLIAAGALGSAPATATNGYFAHGYSVAQRAMGGVGTALVEDAMVVAVNPANVVWVGDEVGFGMSFFRPVRDYSASERGEGAGAGIFTVSPVDRERSLRQRFFIPGVALSRRIDERSAWGLAVYGNGGLNTIYRGNTARFGENLPLFETECQGTFGGGPPVDGASDFAGFCGNGLSTASVDLIQLFVVPSYSRRVGERLSVGIAPIIAGQRFQAEGLNAFASFSNTPERVSDQGLDYSFGYGGRVGLFYAANEWLQLGASYQSRIRMQNFDKYAGLFAGEGGFDIPSNWNAGIALRPADGHRIGIDFQRIRFDEVPSVGNPLGPNAFVNGCAVPRLLAAQSGGLLGDDGPSPNCLGSESGPGFGWRKVDVWKFGYQVAVGSFVLRAGYSRGNNPITSSEVLFNILAPGVPKEHFTAGLSFRATERWSIDMAAMVTRNNPVSGKNPLSSIDTNLLGLLLSGGLGIGDTSEAFGPDPSDQDITLDMRQLELTLGATYRF